MGIREWLDDLNAEIDGRPEPKYCGNCGDPMDEGDEREFCSRACYNETLRDMKADYEYDNWRDA